MPITFLNLARGLTGVLAAAIVVCSVEAGDSQAQARAEVDASATLSGSYLAGRFAGNLRDAPAAARYYRQALEQDPGNPVLLERSFLLSLVAGDIDEAMPLADRVVSVDSTHRVARLALAVEALRSRQYREAQRHLRESRNGPLAELTAALLLAWAQVGAGDLPAAMATVETLHGPEWQEIFRPDYHSGLLAEIGGDLAAAARHYRRAYEVDSQALRIVQAWARHLAREGRRDAALEVLDKFDAVLPEHPLIQAMRSDILSGRVPVPVAAIPKEGAAEVLYGIGAALGNETADEFSAIYLQLALQLAPRHGLALLSLANFFEKVDNPERAIEVYQRVPEESPLHRTAEIHRALNLDDLDRLDEARALLNELIAAEPEHRESIVALGNVLRGRELFEEAAEVYSRAIALIDEPAGRHWSLFYFRGISYERSGQWPEAERDFKQALALEPEQPYVLNYLGYSWIDQNIRLDEALEMIVRAVEQRPNDGYIVDSLGWAYYRLGRYEEAVRELERAVELRSDDPIINDHLGDAYWKVGRRIEARFQWTHARDLGPEPDLLEEILVKLEAGLPETEERNRSAADLRESVE